ncbi:MAG TPA: CBS domain-containing protein [Reyranella sp.]|nr:CBS domain-containing protein [Reyranella sp.]
MRAKDMMSTGVLSVKSDATVYQAAELLANSRVSAMPVLDDAGFMVGIVSEADLIERVGMSTAAEVPGLMRRVADDMNAAAAYVRANSTRIVDIMTRDVVTAPEDATLSDVARLMMERKVKRVPILRGRSVVGIVSRVDLLQALISCRPGEQPAAEGEAPAVDGVLRREVEATVRGRVWSLARNADVVVKDSVVHLWGVVPNEMVRRAYQVAAENVSGVKGVEMHMHVVANPLPRAC